jgi:hypothetical protein
MRQLVREQMAESFDRAARETPDGHVPRLESADPEMRRALRLEIAGLVHDSHDSLPSAERILPEPVREPPVVILDGRRDAEQGLVPAIGLDAVPGLRRERDTGSAEARVLARECLSLLLRELLELLDRPRRVAPRRELRARASETFPTKLGST